MVALRGRDEQPGPCATDIIHMSRSLCYASGMSDLESAGEQTELDDTAEVIEESAESQDDDEETGDDHDEHDHHHPGLEAELDRHREQIAAVEQAAAEATSRADATAAALAVLQEKVAAMPEPRSAHKRLIDRYYRQ